MMYFCHRFRKSQNGKYLNGIYQLNKMEDDFLNELLEEMCEMVEE